MLTQSGIFTKASARVIVCLKFDFHFTYQNETVAVDLDCGAGLLHMGSDRQLVVRLASYHSQKAVQVANGRLLGVQVFHVLGEYRIVSRLPLRSWRIY